MSAAWRDREQEATTRRDEARTLVEWLRGVLRGEHPAGSTPPVAETLFDEKGEPA